MYRGCEIVFDSSDVPEQALSAAGHSAADVQVRTRCTPDVVPPDPRDRHRPSAVAERNCQEQFAVAAQVDLAPLQQQVVLVRQAPEGADIAPSLAAIADLLWQPPLADAADAADAAARLVAEVAEGREAAGKVERLAHYASE